MASRVALLAFFLLSSSISSQAKPLANPNVQQRPLRILSSTSNPKLEKDPPDGKTLSWSLSVFLIPPPVDFAQSNQLLHRTVRSLLRLSPTPDVILLGNHSSFAGLVTDYPGSVRQDCHVDFVFSPGSPNRHGLPLFHSVIARALLASSDLSMVVNADVALVNETALSHTIREAVERFPAEGFLMTWPRYLVSQYPAVLANVTKSGGQLAEDAALASHVVLFGRLETDGGAGAWLWNNNGGKLYKSDMPPFPADRSELDTWLAHAALLETDRAVVEGGTSVICASIRRSEGEERLTEMESKRKDFDFVGAHRVKEKRDERPARNPLIVKECHNVHGKACLESVNCKGPSPSDNKTSNLEDQLNEREKWLCKAVAQKPHLTVQDLGDSFQIKDGMTLEELLPIMADDRKIVTVVGVSSHYSNMLMNFVCTLRRIGLRDPLIVALDEELYRFAMTLGLPVYLEKFDFVLAAENLPDKKHKEKCSFGTICFEKVTKSKPLIVLQILKMGYNVLWTDVDIVWFRDPIKEFYDCGPHTFAVQADSKWEEEPANSRRESINSGFYLARAEPLVIRALETIIEHAKKHKAKSEQPSFYSVLCGDRKERVIGDNECFWEGLRTIFMSRALHPNGGVFNLWDKNVTEECKVLGCATIHNNYISGLRHKIGRLKRQNLWFWMEKYRRCLYDDIVKR